MKIIFSLILIAAIFNSCTTPGELELYSPDKSNIIRLGVDDELNFEVDRSSDNIIERSVIGFRFANSPYLGKDLEILEISKREVNETWQPILKRYASINNHYNEMVVRLKEKRYPGRDIEIQFRAYDDGVAFRTLFHFNDSGFTYTIMDETAEFNFKDDHTCWGVDYDGFDSHQESEFKLMKLSDMNGKAHTGLPMTIKFENDLYGAITEAALVDYAGMYLEPGTHSNSVAVQLAPRHGQEREGEKVRFKGTHQTPWRVVILGKTPGDLVESEIIQNLNEPCQIENTDWIQPGISAWDHWWSGEVKMEQEVVLEYIDLAADMGWPYMLIDWQWYGQFDRAEADITTVAPQLNMPEILQYAKEKGVRCWLWLYWTDVDRADFDAACELYHEWGIAGVKIDFMARDDQEMVNWYHDVVKTAANHQLMVDFHGAYKPTGWRRTYPNLLTREGVLGNEYQKWSYRITPEHDCTLPFTRMLAGPMDYTPGGFMNRNKGEFRTGSPAQVQGTRCHELAKFVIFDSPYLVACDHPDHYKDQVGADFLKEVVSVWDDTKVLNGEIGEYITMARRSGDRWFIGSMTNSMGRELEIKLDFLDANSAYRLESYSDTEKTSEDATFALKSDQEVGFQDKLTLNMAPGGGYVAILVPAK